MEDILKYRDHVEASYIASNYHVAKLQYSNDSQFALDIVKVKEFMNKTKALDRVDMKVKLMTFFDGSIILGVDASNREIRLVSSYTYEGSLIGKLLDNAARSYVAEVTMSTHEMGFGSNPLYSMCYATIKNVYYYKSDNGKLECTHYVIPNTTPTYSFTDRLSIYDTHDPNEITTSINELIDHDANKYPINIRKNFTYLNLLGRLIHRIDSLSDN